MVNIAGITPLDGKIGSGAACPLLANVDGNRNSLLTLLTAMDTETTTLQGNEFNLVAKSKVFDLSGSADTDILFIADTTYTLLSAKQYFVEASSADTGVETKIGKMVVGTDDDDYFVAAVASAASKETGYAQTLTLAQTSVAAGDVIYATCAGGKVGTGNVVIQLVLEKA